MDHGAWEGSHSHQDIYEHVNKKIEELSEKIEMLNYLVDAVVEVSGIDKSKAIGIAVDKYMQDKKKKEEEENNKPKMSESERVAAMLGKGEIRSFGGFSLR